MSAFSTVRRRLLRRGVSNRPSGPSLPMGMTSRKKHSSGKRSEGKASPPARAHSGSPPKSPAPSSPPKSPAPASPKSEDSLPASDAQESPSVDLAAQLANSDLVPGSPTDSVPAPVITFFTADPEKDSSSVVPAAPVIAVHTADPEKKSSSMAHVAPVIAVQTADPEVNLSKSQPAAPEIASNMADPVPTTQQGMTESSVDPASTAANENADPTDTWCSRAKGKRLQK